MGANKHNIKKSTTNNSSSKNNSKPANNITNTFNNHN